MTSGSAGRGQGSTRAWWCIGAARSPRSALPFSGIEVTREPLRRAGYLVDLGALGSQIVVRAQDPVGRQRFTIAHEVAHLVLKEEGITSVGGSQHTRRAQIEHWCDRFAVNLLMPREWVIAYVKTARLSTLIRTVLVGPKRFGVSHEAFRLRIAELLPIGLYQLERSSGRVIVRRRYHSSQLDRGLVHETLRCLGDQLAARNLPLRMVHETGLQSLQASRPFADSSRLLVLLPSRKEYQVETDSI